MTTQKKTLILLLSLFNAILDTLGKMCVLFTPKNFLFLERVKDEGRRTKGEGERRGRRQKAEEWREVLKLFSSFAYRFRLISGCCTKMSLDPLVLTRRWVSSLKKKNIAFASTRVQKFIYSMVLQNLQETYVEVKGEKGEGKGKGGEWVLLLFRL